DCELCRGDRGQNVALFLQQAAGVSPGFWSWGAPPCEGMLPSSLACARRLMPGAVLLDVWPEPAALLRHPHTRGGLLTRVKPRSGCQPALAASGPCHRAAGVETRRVRSADVILQGHQWPRRYMSAMRSSRGPHLRRALPWYMRPTASTSARPPILDRRIRP